MPPLSRPVLALGVVLCLSGCSRDEIQTYKVAKPAPQPNATSMPSHAGMSGTLPEGHPPMEGQTLPPGHPPLSQTNATGPSGALEGSEVLWTAPSGWTPKALGQMRQGSYTVKTAQGQETDLSIFVFPGAAGGFRDNINRWRNQVGLSPQSEEQLLAESKVLKTESGLEIRVVQLKGDGGESILGAILNLEGRSWFFKMKGPTEAIETLSGDFDAFLTTVKLR